MLPYAVVRPYWTWELAGLLVVQLTVTPVVPMLVALTPLMVVGPGGGGGVVVNTTSTQ